MPSCGAKALCCHIGYPHRHCEHCDTVIATGWHYGYPLQPHWMLPTSGGLGAQLQAMMGTSGNQSHACEVK